MLYVPVLNEMTVALPAPFSGDPVSGDPVVGDPNAAAAAHGTPPLPLAPPASLASAAPAQPKDLLEAQAERTFAAKPKAPARAFLNDDGSVGTRNILGIATTVQCVSATVEFAVRRIR